MKTVMIIIITIIVKVLYTFEIIDITMYYILLLSIGLIVAIFLIVFFKNSAEGKVNYEAKMEKKILKKGLVHLFF